MQNFRYKDTRRAYHFAKNVPARGVEDDVVKPAEAAKPHPLHVVVVRVNVVRPLASLVFGKNHSVGHRMLAGTLVMAIGVMIAKYVGHSANEIIAHLGDGIGYGLHGIGLIPFIESMASKFE